MMTDTAIAHEVAILARALILCVGHVEETTACKASAFAIDAQAGGVDFPLEWGTTGSHA